MTIQNVHRFFFCLSDDFFFQVSDKCVEEMERFQVDRGSRPCVLQRQSILAIELAFDSVQSVKTSHILHDQLRWQTVAHAFLYPTTQNIEETAPGALFNSRSEGLFNGKA